MERRIKKGGEKDAEYAEVRSFDQGAEVTDSDVLNVLAESGASYSQVDPSVRAAHFLPVRDVDGDGTTNILNGGLKWVNYLIASLPPGGWRRRKGSN
jgi:hypothetical protein